KDEGGHELHGLELRPGECAREEPEAHPEHGVRDRELHNGERRMAGFEPEEPERESGHQCRLDRGERGECDPVPDEQIASCDRGGEQAFQRPGDALAEHRDRGDDEHSDEGEQAEERHAELLKDLWAVGEEGVHEDLEHARHHEQEGDRSGVVPKLTHHALRRRPRSVTAQLAAVSRISARKASSRSSVPVLSRSSAGVAEARTRPSRSKIKRSHRSASSITRLETRRLVPCSASEWKKAQSSRRSRGSSPTVGSSRTRRAGSPSSATASDTLARCPPERFATVRLVSACSSTRSMTSLTRAAPTPTSFPKYSRFS